MPAVDITPFALDISDFSSQIFLAYLAQDAAWDAGEAQSMKKWPSCVKVARERLDLYFGTEALLTKYPVHIG